MLVVVVVVVIITIKATATAAATTTMAMACNHLSGKRLTSSLLFSPLSRMRYRALALVATAPTNQPTNKRMNSEKMAASAHVSPL